MYHAIVRRIARRNFLRVNAGDHASLLADCAPNVRHRFGGAHALGGTRASRDALLLWFARLGRLSPALRLTVEDVWVKGWPHDTVVIVRWSATDRPADGSPYSNRGVHVVRMRWGRITDIDAHEDSEAVAANLRRLAAFGVAEASAAPITG